MNMWPSVCTYPPAGTDQAYYELVLKRAAVLLSALQLNLMKFALSLRAYSATVHSFQQVRQDVR